MSMYQELLNEIKDHVGNDRILVQVSGGKDSCAALLLMQEASAEIVAIHFVHRFSYDIPTTEAVRICILGICIGLMHSHVHKNALSRC